MCIIAISPLGEKFSREVFERMWSSNPHGFGMAFPTKNGIGIVKGIMREDEAWEEYQALPRGVPHILHFRYATHGGVRPELTHPFVVHEGSPLVIREEVGEPVLVHNGVWDLYALHLRELDLKGPVSDSRVLAAFVGKVGVENANAHAREIESAGRVAILTPDRRLKLFGSWIRDGDFLYSNSGYKAVAARWWKGWESVAK